MGIPQARAGRGPIGDLVKRYDLEQKVKDNQPKIQEAVTNFGKNGLDIVQRIFTTIVAGITVMVLTVLILVEGPRLSAAMACGTAPKAYGKLSTVVQAPVLPRLSRTIQ